MRRVTLSTDRDLVVLSAVYRGLVLWSRLWIFNDHDNCNVNDNGINNGNGGETL